MTERRWVVFGAGGMLGAELVDSLQRQGVPVLALARADADITDPASIAPRLAAGDIVANCAAWTRVDDAESHRDATFALNAEGPLHLARACSDVGATLVHFSTDYVFGDARAGTPIPVDAPLRPTCVYGESKAQGERNVRTVLGEDALIARVAWLYGAHGRNFVRTIVDRLELGAELRVVEDQIGQPTWTRDVATAVLQLVQAGRRGTQHLTSAGQCSWYEFACAIAAASGHDAGRIAPVPTSAYPTAARRPAWSVLAHGAPHPMPHWRDALTAYLA